MTMDWSHIERYYECFSSIRLCAINSFKADPNQASSPEDRLAGKTAMERAMLAAYNKCMWEGMVEVGNAERARENDYPASPLRKR